MEFQILNTFPPNLFLSLWFYLSLYISPSKYSRLELGSHCWFFLFLGHPHTHSISKSHLVTPLLVLCSILVPAAHFSYQDASTNPTLWLGLQQLFSISHSAQSLQKGNQSLWVSAQNPLLPLTLFPPQDQLYAGQFLPENASLLFLWPAPSHSTLRSILSKAGLHA